MSEKEEERERVEVGNGILEVMEKLHVSLCSASLSMD